MCCDDKIIDLGQNGSDGTDGVSSYMHIGYADANDGTGFSLTQNGTKNFIAFLSNSSSSDPVQADFNGLWFQYKGTTSSPTFEVFDEGVSIVTGVDELNFTGPGITVTNAGGGRATISIIAAGLIEISRANALNLIATDSLISGAWYWIYDVGDGIGLSSGTAGIILRAVSENKFTPDGVFIARIIDRSVVTNMYDSVNAVIANTYYENFNEVYKSVTGINNNIPPASDISGGAWEYINKDNNTYYKTEIQQCIYDIDNDLIKERWDSRGNHLTNVYITPSANELILQCFRWGTDSVYNNDISYYQINAGWSVDRLPIDISILNIASLACDIFNNNLKNNSIRDTLFVSTTTNDLSNNYIENSTIEFSDANVVLSCFIISNSGLTTISKLTLAQLEIQESTVTSTNEDNSIWYGGTIKSSTLELNSINTAAYISNINIINSSVTNIQYDPTYTENGIGSVGSLYNINIINSYIDGKNDPRAFWNSGNTYHSSFIDITPNYSKYIAILDISDGTVYDAGTNTLTIPESLRHAGAIHLYNTNGESILKILNLGTLSYTNLPHEYPIIFRCIDGIGIQFTPTAAGAHVPDSGDFQSAAANKILTKSNYDTYTIVPYAHNNINTEFNILL